MTKFRNVVLLTVVSLVLLLILAACGDKATVVIQVNGLNDATPAIAATPSAPTIGGPVRHQGYVLTVNAFDTSDKSATGDAPELGFVFLNLDITLASELDKGFQFYRSYMSVTDMSDTSYSPQDDSKQPQLDSSYFDIPKGSSKHGWVEFEVHANATNLSLVYTAPDFLKIPLKLSLPINNNTNIPSTAAAVSHLQFTPFVAPGSIFSIAMPTTPTESQQDITVSGQNLTYHSFNAALPQAKTSWNVGYFEPKADNSLNLDFIREYFEYYKLGGSVLSTKPITSGQLEGVEDEYIVSLGSTIFYRKARFLLSKDRLYFYSVSYPDNSQIAADIQTFLDSFKLVVGT
jgi:hypothetical protein